MKTNELTYDDLKLGEKAKDALFSGQSLEYIRENCPIYLNTNDRGAIAGLNTTDLAIAGVLAGMPVLVGGQYGSGKSQLAFDMFRYYFGGAKLSGGEGVKIDVNPDTNIMEPTNNIYSGYSGKQQNGIITPQVELSKNVGALFHFIDEINRTPTPKQNQFYSLLNGHVTHEGKDFPVGREGFRAVVATANIGNGLYQGTFDFDPALRNRFGIVIDTNYALFEPTEEDRGLIALLREADPGLKSAPLRNISEQIIKANKEIRQSSTALSLDERAVVWYLQEGLKTCQKKKDSTGVKEGEFWFDECRDCPLNNNPSERAVCSFMSSPVFRTLEATKLYASALAYLSRLKNPDKDINGTDLMFKAFELTAAYQPFANPDVVQGYKGHFGKFMQDSTAKLKEDFRTKQDEISSTLEAADRGKTLYYIKSNGTLSKLSMDTVKLELDADKKPSESVTKNYDIVNPFEEDRLVSIKWVPTRANLLRQMAKVRGK